MVGLIVAALAITTMTEPKRTAISEEAENDNNEVPKPRSVQTSVTPAESTEKVSIWKVLFQPKILILCIAASIRHTGTPDVLIIICRWTVLCILYPYKIIYVNIIKHRYIYYIRIVLIAFIYKLHDHFLFSMKSYRRILFRLQRRSVLSGHFPRIRSRMVFVRGHVLSW